MNNRLQNRRFTQNQAIDILRGNGCTVDVDLKTITDGNVPTWTTESAVRSLLRRGFKTVAR